ncbi:MAG: glycerol-3-phosphate dehydrogenase C-terminal domain-containing protein [Acidimicrobiales bacterium]
MGGSVEAMLQSVSTSRDITEIARSLADRFGARATEAATTFQHDEDFVALTSDSGLLLGELRSMISHEQVRLPRDIVFRRTRLGILDLDLARRLANKPAPPTRSTSLTPLVRGQTGARWSTSSSISRRSAHPSDPRATRYRRCDVNSI